MFLKVKLKSLAAEARIIRDMERKHPDFWYQLREHRKGVVRDSARHTQLAYGFLRGREYRQIEPKCHKSPDFDQVEKMVKKYGMAIVFDGDGVSRYTKAWYDQLNAYNAGVMERFRKWMIT